MLTPSEPLNVIAWKHFDDCQDHREIGWLGGIVKEGWRWEHYVNQFAEAEKPYLEAVRADILAKQLRLTGEQHQYGDAGMPVFSDGTVLRLSYRAWADLMAAIWATAENTDYHYMDFYM